MSNTSSCIWPIFTLLVACGSGTDSATLNDYSFGSAPSTTSTEPPTEREEGSSSTLDHETTGADGSQAIPITTTTNNSATTQSRSSGESSPTSSSQSTLTTPDASFKQADSATQVSPTFDMQTTTMEALDAGSGTNSTEPLTEITIFLAGDSTVSQYADTASETDQAGWGQMLHEYLDARAHVDNRAIGGRTARRFIDDGALADIEADLVSGDILMLQFGTNDGNRTATYELNGEQIPYYLDPNTDFKTYLGDYIDAALARGATPILVTPPPRNSAYCTGGNGTGAHAEAMRALALERGVPVVDLNARSVAYLQAICPAPTPEDFFLLRPDGSVDGTHFQEHGARVLAGLVAHELVLAATPLERYVLSGEN